jgi:ABC-type multidrug transport system fused ATPase/permease subunit
MRWRVHGGALSRFFLDALTGLVAIRAHGGERVLRREHDHLLREWVKAGAERGRVALLAQGLQGLLGCTLATVLLFSSGSANYDPSNLLLLVYWILNLPLLSSELTAQFEQFAMNRNIALRLLEPLGAPEEAEKEQPSPIHAARASSAGSGCSIQFERATVRAGGQVILKEISLEIEGGSHVAIVGPSGAGKSSLLGTLLGWHRPSHGQILVDQCRLDGDRLEKLRAETAWMDPSIQIWNQSLEANLIYGISPDQAAELPISEGLEKIKLLRILQKLPDGLQTAIGEGGGLLSGGEGQQVRLARAWLRPEVRLVLLDEPFHGLDREDRQHLFEQFRQKYRQVTFLCILHDLEATRQFDRILVMEKGQIIEDGSPLELAQRSNSLYREMLESEKRHRETLWSARYWRQARIQNGKWVEFHPAEENPWNS